ncbi:MAG: hypothetical protein U1A77_14865 [Pirellulales bacterium]
MGCVRLQLARRGRRALEARFPALAHVSTDLLHEQSQADPKFQVNLPYTRVTGTLLRTLLQSHAELADIKPPAVRTCQRLMDRLGFCLRPVHKANPLAKIPATDAIFAHLQQLHHQPSVIRSQYRRSARK